MNRPSLVWFRRDLRLEDQPALLAAIEYGSPVIPVYIQSSVDEGEWPAGAASRWWLHHSLSRLAEQLNSLGSKLIIRDGDPNTELISIIEETDASAVFWTRRYEPSGIEFDIRVKADLKSRGVHAESFNGQLLFEPWDVQTKEGRPYQVFTSFWKSCLSRPAPAPPTAPPGRIPLPDDWPASVSIDQLGLKPKIRWDFGLEAAWEPGAKSGKSLLRRFLNSTVSQYDSSRDKPGEAGTSRMSPYLHFGEISPRLIWHEALSRLSGPDSLAADSGTETFLREIGWREFAHHLLFHFPTTDKQPLRNEFAGFPWNEDAEGLTAWQRGATGFPIVDAGMRELWTTGWMHNRVRMIVASFLVKDLLVPWKQGADWFWDTLVDADLASNTLGWQWTSGCGADAAPYFRVFNPMLQSEKFDPSGVYLHRWLPELKQLPAPWVHSPWTAPESVLTKANVRLGKSYPLPIVDHAVARQRALDAFARIKSGK
jgi:deoxyribodipyrimidine photo-lyase